jgi:hypothetical protein
MGYMCSECSVFLIFNFFKKCISPLNAAIMTLNAIIRKNPYFSIMKIHTHDLFIKAK